jgi:4-diphosphocytidyl-2-C-methyl-D-erythritol kinase
MKHLKLLAPAKINLYLRVLRERPDRYHEIETIMQAVSLFDTLEIKENRGGDIKIATTHPALPTDRHNLVYQAVLVLTEYCKIKAGVTISIDKRIPIGAGLGGGSSDAAATLLGLNKLWNLGLSTNELVYLSARLGSDVAFFIKRGTALCQSRGEITFSIPIKKRFYYIIISPRRDNKHSIPLGVPTAEIYSKIKKKDLTENGKNAKMIISALESGNCEQMGMGLFNQFEKPVFELYPQIAYVYNALSRMGSCGVALSGTGSSLFVLCRDIKEQTSTAGYIKNKRLGGLFKVHNVFD